MAWKLPMGRSNWRRTLAYSTAMSSARCAPPSCSAASAIGGHVQGAVERRGAVAGRADQRAGYPGEL